jgi:hypothetical protein
MTPELVDRAAKLLRVICSTGPDGEKLAAADRLSAFVVANDLDWDRALAGTGPTREQMQELFNAGLQRGPELGRAEKAGNSDWAAAGQSRADEIGDRESELQQILNAAARSKADGLLSGWFANFASDMQERLDRWDRRTFVTERQWECLNKLRSILERQGYLDNGLDDHF